MGQVYGPGGARAYPPALSVSCLRRTDPMAYTTEDIRNIALVGQASAGKTTLFEALLHAGGVIQTAGSIERGTTVSDLRSAGEGTQAFARHRDRLDRPRRCHINLIDTPGSPDFRGPTLSALAAVETCAIVVNATTGIEHQHAPPDGSREAARPLPHSRRQQDRSRAATMSQRWSKQLRDEFGTECLPINLPAQDGKQRSSTASSSRAARAISRRSAMRTSTSSTRSSRSTRP